jgi:hypothetical protein
VCELGSRYCVMRGFCLVAEDSVKMRGWGWRLRDPGGKKGGETVCCATWEMKAEEKLNV